MEILHNGALLYIFFQLNSVMLHWQLYCGHGKNIYTMVIGKHHLLGLFLLES
jgi:hypothetical protein